MLVGSSNRQLPCRGCLVYVCSPDGKLLVFLSSQAAVNTGAHSATNSLHSIDWPANGSLGPHMQIRDVVCMHVTIVSDVCWGPKMLHVGYSKILGGQLCMWYATNSLHSIGWSTRRVIGGLTYKLEMWSACMSLWCLMLIGALECCI
jgi:hypothetical protein